MSLDAVLWDYDGTLVNSVPKNIDITKSILSVVAPHLTGENLPKCLLSESAYQVANHAAKNWQELYCDFYGLSEKEMLQAGALWSKYQKSNKTAVNLFDGIRDIINQFDSIPHGVCSQNSAANIWHILEKNGIDRSFHSVIGYDDVENHQQKPHYSGGIKCLNALFGQSQVKHIMYVGDHEADVIFAKNIQNRLGDDSKVISVAVAYSGASPQSWVRQADHVAFSVADLNSIIGQYT